MHEIALTVRYVECDMQGHVFNGHYLTWFDMAHTAALEARLGPYATLLDRGIDVVVAHAEVSFRAPARFGEELHVGCAFRAPGTTSLTSDLRVRRGDVLVAEGTLRHVCVAVPGHTKTPWPAWATDALA